MREAVGGVRAAFMRMLDAHVALLRAELAITGKELGIIIGLVLGALAVLALVATLVLVGGLLFYGEWLYGSMGWGIIHGALLGGVLVAYAAINLGGGRTLAYWHGALAGLIAGAAVVAVLLSNIGNRIFEAGRGFVEERIGTGGIVIASEAVAGVIGFVIGGIVLGAAGGLIGWLIERGTGRPRGLTSRIAALGFVIGALGAAFLAGSRLDVPEVTVGSAWITTLLGFVTGGVVIGAITGYAAWQAEVRGGLRFVITVAVILGGILGAIFASTRYEAADGVIGLGIMIGLITWIVTAVILAQRRGFDPEGRYADLVPRESLAAFERTKDFMTEQWERQKNRMLGR